MFQFKPNVHSHSNLPLVQPDAALLNNEWFIRSKNRSPGRRHLSRFEIFHTVVVVVQGFCERAEEAKALGNTGTPLIDMPARSAHLFFPSSNVNVVVAAVAAAATAAKYYRTYTRLYSYSTSSLQPIPISVNNNESESTPTCRSSNKVFI